MAAKSKPTSRPRRSAAPARPPSDGAVDNAPRRTGSRVIRETPPRAPVPASAPPSGSGKAAESRGKYVYCVIRSEDPLRFGAIGIAIHGAEDDAPAGGSQH